jgi:hypothetical protein
MEGFCAERDDVLISIQRILFKEAPILGEVPARPPVEARRPAPAPSIKGWPYRATSGGSARPLRRDFMLEQALPPAWRSETDRPQAAACAR